MVASYWDTLDAMTASEQAVQVSRKEVTELLGGTVTVEHYEVPVFVRRSRPQRGAGVRLSRVDCAPASIDAVIEDFRNTAVPALTAMPGLCSAHMMTDRATGRCIVITAWDDMDALAASRPATARLRADVAAVTHLQVRSVEEYKLVFSSVRDGDTRSLIERNIELWNARDREGWMAGMDLDRLELQAPGGLRLAGREAADAIWSTWNEAFPDNRLEIIAIHADVGIALFGGAVEQLQILRIQREGFSRLQVPAHGAGLGAAETGNARRRQNQLSFAVISAFVQLQGQK